MPGDLFFYQLYDPTHRADPTAMPFINEQLPAVSRYRLFGYLSVFNSIF